MAASPTPRLAPGFPASLGQLLPEGLDEPVGQLGRSQTGEGLARIRVWKSPQFFAEAEDASHSPVTPAHLLSPQLPPPPAHQTPPAPQASQRQRPWRKLLTVHPDTEPRQALATALPSSGGGVCGQYQLDPETEGTSQSSLVATGTKVVTLNVFAEKKRKYKLDLVLQMSFPQRLQHGTPGILKKKPH